MELSVIEDVLSNKAMWHLELGDCLGVLRGMPSESVHTVITSPPYFNLRDYGTGRWEGGDEGCDHKPASTQGQTGQRADRTFTASQPYKDVCHQCGARRIDQQIGLERTPLLFVERLVEVFREVRRVLRSDGCAWVNMGDSYNSNTHWSGGGPNAQAGNTRRIVSDEVRSIVPGLKPKDLMGLPWRLAFALQGDGWYLRQDIIWHKPAPMPESVTDRCTKAHEYIFLLSKSERYFYDIEAIREPMKPENNGWMRAPQLGTHRPADPYSRVTVKQYDEVKGSNRRSVWSIPTEPLKDAHYAAYPTRLPELCLLAGTSARGCCPECGAQWRRVVEVSGGAIGHSWHNHGSEERLGIGQRVTDRSAKGGHGYKRESVGWQPTCTHAHEPIPSLVLDPFAGSGSTLIAALRNGRRALGIDISEEYGRIARRRLMGVTIPHPELIAV